MSLALAESISTDLVQVVERAEAAISALVADGDGERLRETAVQADAHRLYEKRAGATERANVFARIKLLAEAGLGALSFETYPTLAINARKEGVEIAGNLIPETTAKRWRLLAIAHERGVLLDTLNDLATKGESLGTHNVADAVSVLGVTGVPAKTVMALIDKHATKQGLSKFQLAHAVGLNPNTLYTTGTTMYWQNAKAITEALGADVTKLPFAPRKRTRPRYRRLWLTRERKLTGGRWDETYSRFRKCLDEFSRTAGEGTEWNNAYEHFYALEEILGRALKRKAVED